MSLGDSTVLFRALPKELKISIEDRRLLRKFSKALAQDVAGGRPFNCLITNDRVLHKLNQQFLHHDYPTDVLSFPAEDSEFLGDLAISVERAEAQAAAFGHDRSAELRILMLHGVLHLIGFDHERDRGQMARAERKWKSYFGLPATLIARTRHERAS